MPSDFATFAARRRELVSRMGPEALTIIFSGRAPVRSNDVHFRFRTNSDFYYLSGFEEEDCTLVITAEECVLFLPDADAEHAVWHGPQLGVASAAETLGVDRALPVDGLAAELPNLLKNRTTLYYQYGRSPESDLLIFGKTDLALRRARRGETAPVRVLHPQLLLHEMRLIKSPVEQAALRECARVTAAAHVEAMSRTRPGVRENELEAIFQYHFRRENGQEGYPAIVASGKNACVLHYIKNNRRIEEGDLVLIDAAVEKDYQNADVTRTFPASRRFSGAQREVYDLVLAVQKRAIERVVVGSNMEALHGSVVRELTEGLVEIGALTGTVEEIVERELYKKYFMHGTGHWLGSDVHDVGSYYSDGRPRLFVDGMVLTVEPGLYFSPDAPDVPPAFAGIGVRIEDDVLVRGPGPENLTAAIPKEVADLEALVGSGIADAAGRR